MNTNTEQTIYIISGPCGVGKSTLSKELANHLEKSALIDGDHFLEMYGEGSEPPWEERLNIMWKNTVFSTLTLIQHDFNVILDILIKIVCLNVSKSVDRSLFLLNQLENTAGNEKHLYDTSNK